MAPTIFLAQIKYSWDILKKSSQKSKKEFYAKIVVGLKQSKNGLDVDSLLTNTQCLIIQSH